MTDDGGRHILIVDDYPDALDIWAIYLRALGYRVSTAADGAAALAQAEQLLPDLIVLDLELPGISGFEVASACARNPDTHDIPLIAATGYSHVTQLDRRARRASTRSWSSRATPTCSSGDRAAAGRDEPVRQPSHMAVATGAKNG